MERDIPHRDTPGTFLFINFSSKYFKFIPNNAISFQLIIFHSKENTFSFMFVEGFFKWWFQDLFFFLFPICFCFSNFHFVFVSSWFFKHVFVSLMFSVSFLKISELLVFVFFLISLFVLFDFFCFLFYELFWTCFFFLMVVEFLLLFIFFAFFQIFWFKLFRFLNFWIFYFVLFFLWNLFRFVLFFF